MTAQLKHVALTITQELKKRIVDLHKRHAIPSAVYQKLNNSINFCPASPFGANTESSRIMTQIVESPEISKNRLDQLDSDADWPLASCGASIYYKNEKYLPRQKSHETNPHSPNNVNLKDTRTSGQSKNLLPESSSRLKNLISICSTVYSGSTLLGLFLERLCPQSRFWGEINRLDAPFNKYRLDDLIFRDSLLRTSALHSFNNNSSDPIWSEALSCSSWPAMMECLANEDGPFHISTAIEDSKFGDWIKFITALARQDLPGVEHCLLILYRNPTEWLQSLLSSNPSSDVEQNISMYVNEYIRYLASAATHGRPIYIVSHEKFTSNPFMVSRTALRAIVPENDLISSEHLPMDCRKPIALGGNPRSYFSHPTFLASMLTRLQYQDVDSSMSSLSEYANSLADPARSKPLDDLIRLIRIIPKKACHPSEAIQALMAFMAARKIDGQDDCVSANTIEALDRLLRTLSLNEQVLIDDPEYIQGMIHEVLTQ